MKFILGTKLNMTQVFDNDGVVHPATILVAPEVTVTQIKTIDNDGYGAVQIGTGTQKAERINTAQIGHTKDLGNFKLFKEFRVQDPSVFKVGDKISLAQFIAGDVVEVSAITKGKGFQGVVKRHGFGGGPRTHGQKHSEREPGSIGGGLRNKVPKKMRMAGRMGGDRVTVKNLKVLHIDTDNDLVYVKGAVPGRRGTVVEIKA